MRTEISSVAELPEMHRMGHTCTNLNGDLIFVWGGTSEDVAYSKAPNTDLWIYETLTGYWRHRKCSGECPPYLSSCSSALIGQKMFIFGGHSSAQDNWLNCLYCLDLDTFVWRDLGAQARAEPAKPIRSDKNVAWSYGNKMYVFGGYGWSQVEHYLELTDKQADLQLVPDFRWPKYGWNNQLVEYNPADKTWRWPSYKGKCPSARAAHSGALMGDKYFVFGGRDSQERLNDLYTFDMKTFEWQRIAVFSAASNNSISTDRQLITRWPIGHLLDGPGEPSNGQQHNNNNSVQVGVELDNEDSDDDEHIDPAADENHRQLVEEMHGVEVEEEDSWNPHPSSSAEQGADNISMDQITGETTMIIESNQNAAEDDDDDDFEYPHPSHLLERWSLSSRNPHNMTHNGSNRQLGSSMDDGNNNGDNNDNADSDCLYETQHNQHQQDQEQNFMSVTDRSQPGQQQEPMLATTNQDHRQQVEEEGLRAQQGNDELGHNQQLAHGIHDQQADRQDRAGGPPVSPVVDHAAIGTIPSAPTMPAGRSFCSLTPISDENILLFGGVDSNDRNLDDCWLFNICKNQWTQITDYKHKRSRLWHTGAKTKQNEIVIMGGSSSEKIDEYCTDVFVMSFEPKSLKRLALDAVSRSVRIKTIQRTKGLPSTLVKLIKLRKQAMALTMRRSASQRLLTTMN
uniref:Kelch domain-containing protein 1 n=1 Tax=Aceria tosichella TaxID=561515 RepID=A0A6G1SKK6_9ACAR